jgi:hypothetical protein
VANADGERFTGRWDIDNSNLEGEEWRQWSAILWVSNHGRIQLMKRNGKPGSKRFPENRNKKGYLDVQVDGQKKGIHTLVGELFFIGPRPRNWKHWDHKDHNVQNNHISNIRPVTYQENAVNTARQRLFYIWRQGKPEERIPCRCQRETARDYKLNRGNLGSVLHKRADKHGNVPNAVKGWCAAWADEVDAASA